MTTAGWIFMLLSLGVVLGVAGWCFWRVLGTGASRVQDGGSDADE